MVGVAHVTFFVVSLLSADLIDTQSVSGTCITPDCRDCIDGYTGIACSTKCRYPSYGKRCQFLCSCLEEDCVASTGCGNVNGSPKKPPLPKSAVQDSTNKTGEPAVTQRLTMRHLLLSIVGVLCVVLVTISAKYIWKKHYVQRKNGDENGKKKKTNHFKGLLNRQTLCSEVTNENVYDELDERKMNADEKMNRNDVFKMASKNTDYVDSLEFKKEKVSTNRESQHIYKSLE